MKVYVIQNADLLKRIEAVCFDKKEASRIAKILGLKFFTAVRIVECDTDVNNNILEISDDTDVYSVSKMLSTGEIKACAPFGYYGGALWQDLYTEKRNIVKVYDAGCGDKLMIVHVEAHSEEEAKLLASDLFSKYEEK